MEQLVKLGGAKAFTRQGLGGRSSVSGHTATVFGCTGFLGRYLVNNLGRKGTQVVVPYRGTEDEKRHLKLMGDLGQITPLAFDLRDTDSLRECVRHSDTVYNLIGREYSTKNFSLADVHIKGAELLARICAEEGVNSLVHVSALNADVDSKSEFLRTKALGEKAVLGAFPGAAIVRPGHIYGHEDRFWNKMGTYAKFGFGIPVPRKQTRMRPVYVGDVSAALAHLLGDDVARGKVVELVGPHEYHYAALIRFFSDITHRNPRLVTLPKPILKLFGGVVQRLMFDPAVTADEMERLCIDDVVHSDTLKFADLNISPYKVEETISRFVRLHQPETQQAGGTESEIRKYTTEDLKM